MPTLAQLSARFVDVAGAGRTASLVPEGTGMWGYALAQAASLLTLGGSAGGDTPLNVSETALVLSRAEERLEQGALIEAVSEVSACLCIARMVPTRSGVARVDRSLHPPSDTVTNELFLSVALPVLSF